MYQFKNTKRLIVIASAFVFGIASSQLVAQLPPTQSPAKNEPAPNQKTKVAKPDDQKKPADGITFSNPVDSRWKIGTKIIGGAKPAKNVLITIPVPKEWAEQRVGFDDVEVQSQSRVHDEFRELEGGIRQLMVKMPFLGAREEVIVSITCSVSTSQITAPSDTSVFKVPKSSNREGKNYLGVGPHINHRNAKLRKEVKSIVKDHDSPWAQVEAIFDWVRDNIEDTEQKPGDVVSVFRNRKGCNEDKVGLFVAMCRANKIPARMVWVEGTQRAEFMLVDETKKAHWFPCCPGGLREFGFISDPRVVLQKGDSIRVPEKEKRQKFVAEFVTCQGAGAAAKPRVRFFRELLPNE